MNKGNLQISKGGWLMDYPDAENSYALLYGPNKAPGPNDSNFENSTYDKLFEKMSILPVGSSERKKIICELEKIIQEEVPIFYVMYEDIVRLVRPSLKNYQTRELVINKYKYIEKAK
jgi:ABC-type transport system substrate-binding protein